MEERRRAPRHEVSEEFVHLPATMNVRVLDISTAGVLIQSSRLLNPGAQGSLRFHPRRHPIPRGRSGSAGHGGIGCGCRISDRRNVCWDDS
jgi:hypothetical protein